MNVKNTNNKAFLTVFTPTFNRAYCLDRCYNSMLAQSCKDFIWLIVDDGSTDNTKELVDSWKKKDSGFEIRYIYKENGGMHTAHNVAYENIDTQLNMCIDSDDALSDEAVKKIFDFWKKFGSDKYAGIIGLDCDFDNKIIGKGFEKGKISTTLMDYYNRGGYGDKKLVYRTEIIKSYPPYPEFDGEKFVPLDFKYLLCDIDYELLILDEALCKVEYLTDGSSKNIMKQYMKNPKGFAYVRKLRMIYDTSRKVRVKSAIHYVSSSIISKNKHFLKESPKKLLTFLMIPFGILLTVLVKIKVRNS